MKKPDQPIIVVGTLLALSVGFWGNSMALYIEKGPQRPTWSQIERQLGQQDWTRLTNATSATADGQAGSASYRAEITQAVGRATNVLAKFASPERSGFYGWLNLSREWQNLTPPPEAPEPALKLTAAAYQQLLHSVSLSLHLFFAIWLVTLAAGVLFVIDTACVYWWYYRYIYQVQTTPTLLTYFYDFGVCAAFNLAASRWTDPLVFFLAGAFGSGFLLLRFRNLYRSPEANNSDRRILKSAGKRLAFWSAGMLGAASLLFVVAFRRAWAFTDIFDPLFYSLLTGGLAVIGISLTFRFRERIRLSVERHAVLGRRFEPMQQRWPEPLLRDEEARRQIKNNVREGLGEFHKMFAEPGPSHDRLLSRVHAEGDLFVQGLILAISSWSKAPANGNSSSAVESAEVKHKSFMVGLSHWLDDLLDGREEMAIYDRIEGAQAWDRVFSTEESQAREAFALIYRDVVVTHTDEVFYDRLVKAVAAQSEVPNNVRFLFSSLNRVAVGAMLFSPKFPEEDRKSLLDRHNLALAQGIRKCAPPAGDPLWQDRVVKLLNQLERGPDELGDALLGLTTKTVVELGMASEGPDLDLPLSVLFSLLYAPLLYFHDIKDEITTGEMAAVNPFDVNYEAVIPWLEQVVTLIRERQDERLDSRLLQMEMAFYCFKYWMPEVARERLETIYVGERPTSRVVSLGPSVG